jgi:hypothetical protein
VQGLIVVNADGIPIRTTLDNETSVQARSRALHSPLSRGAAQRRAQRRTPRRAARAPERTGARVLRDAAPARRTCADVGACAPFFACALTLRALRRSPFPFAQYAALVTQFTAKTRTTLKQLPLPGVSSDAGAVRTHALSFACFARFTLHVAHAR